MRFLVWNWMSSSLSIYQRGLRVAISGLFLYSGIVKLVDPLGTADSVRNYDLIGDPWVTAVALFLPWVELVAGGLLMIGRWVPGALAVVMASAATFLLAIGSAWWRGLDISCGCLGAGGSGGGGPLHYAGHMLGLVVLIAVCAWLWCEVERAKAAHSVMSN